VINLGVISLKDFVPSSTASALEDLEGHVYEIFSIEHWISEHLDLFAPGEVIDLITDLRSARKTLTRALIRIQEQN
jgi:hypothetical protein